MDASSGMHRMLIHHIWVGMKSDILSETIWPKLAVVVNSTDPQKKRIKTDQMIVRFIF
jgi:hypothetical protein